MSVQDAYDLITQIANCRTSNEPLPGTDQLSNDYLQAVTLDVLILRARQFVAISKGSRCLVCYCLSLFCVCAACPSPYQDEVAEDVPDEPTNDVYRKWFDKL